jgi:DNA-binding response OmpR family regulator
VLTKSFLTGHVHDQDFDRDSNLIEVHVRRLRKQLRREGSSFVLQKADSGFQLILDVSCQSRR